MVSSLFRFSEPSSLFLGARGFTIVHLLDNLLQAWQNALQPDQNVGLAMAIFACFGSGGRRDL